MAFQFVHMELFSRKGDAKGRSVDFVLAEAERRKDACSHVTTPAAPEVVFGATITQVRLMHDERVSQAKDTMKNGRSRAIRSSQHTLVTVVASHPAQVKEVLVCPEKAKAVREWEDLTVRWLEAKYGSKLISVIRHTDEQQCHLHAYVLPDDAMCKAALLHPGLAAKAVVMSAENEDAKAQNRLGDQAYKASMRQWQDDYYREVGSRCGLARLGPQKRRLSRAEWHAEKKQASALKDTLDRAGEIKRRGTEFIRETKATAARMAQDALQKQQVARETIAEAERQKAFARRYTGLGGFLRAVFDGLRKSTLTATIRNEVATEISRLVSKIKTAEQMLAVETQRRERAERREQDAISTAQKIEIERDVAKSTLNRLKRRYEIPDPTAKPIHGPSLGP